MGQDDVHGYSFMIARWSLNTVFPSSLSSPISWLILSSKALKTKLRFASFFLWYRNLSIRSNSEEREGIVRVEKNNNGVLRYNPNFRGDWCHCFSLYQNLLQSRPFYKFVIFSLLFLDFVLLFFLRFASSSLNLGFKFCIVFDVF